jgi:hypothetical protein
VSMLWAWPFDVESSHGIEQVVPRLLARALVLGTGTRLFGDTSDKKRLRLADSMMVGDSIAILIYEPAPNEAEGSA